MKQQGKRTKKREKASISKSVVIGLAIFLLIIFILTGLSVHDLLHQTQPTPQSKITKTFPTTIPTIDLSQANTFKTYTSDLYGFTATYPALGENRDGQLITCGNAIEEQIRNRNGASIPNIQIDNFYQISVHPWGGQLSDYIAEKDKTILATLPFDWVSVPNVDEAVVFTSQDINGYFKNVFALYKKGNLIYQVEKPQENTTGCQMLFDPRDTNQIFLAKNHSAQVQSLLFEQYKNWNEATSLEFPK